MVQNSSPTGNGLNPGAWAGVGIGAAGCIFVFCMWIFRWSKRDRDNIVRGEDAVAKVKRAFKIDGKGGSSKVRKGTVDHVGKPKLELRKAGDHWHWSALDEERGMGTVKVPSPVAKEGTTRRYVEPAGPGLVMVSLVMGMSTPHCRLARTARQQDSRVYVCSRRMEDLPHTTAQRRQAMKPSSFPPLPRKRFARLVAEVGSEALSSGVETNRLLRAEFSSDMNACKHLANLSRTPSPIQAFHRSTQHYRTLQQLLDAEVKPGKPFPHMVAQTSCINDPRAKQPAVGQQAPQPEGAIVFAALLSIRTFLSRRLPSTRRRGTRSKPRRSCPQSFDDGLSALTKPCIRVDSIVSEFGLPKATK
ncbi:hypothetical protein M409DRAFT_54020 [Zasmidium cellare ATCC 36951]|uniref:Uncharacterized protein n=1 Tax=Zasmidium cellare ATCC 36951 TaxID=1080233 RepID=A0A6A6CNV0_ZASCE|nr:uncharacterized protein M409DRAFT_54020 [Zasmidium cellare ATCC 36951]KAF2167419.1 hypothetical protein M409DRAFT_54020 [Zasmidium cellare ATCC 36951]